MATTKPPEKNDPFNLDFLLAAAAKGIQNKELITEAMVKDGKQQNRANLVSGFIKLTNAFGFHTQNPLLQALQTDPDATGAKAQEHLMSGNVGGYIQGLSNAQKGFTELSKSFEQVMQAGTTRNPHQIFKALQDFKETVDAETENLEQLNALVPEDSYFGRILQNLEPIKKQLPDLMEQASSKFKKYLPEEAELPFEEAMQGDLAATLAKLSIGLEKTPVGEEVKKKLVAAGVMKDSDKVGECLKNIVQDQLLSEDMNKVHDGVKGIGTVLKPWFSALKENKGDLRKFTQDPNFNQVRVKQDLDSLGSLLKDTTHKMADTKFMNDTVKPAFKKMKPVMEELLEHTFKGIGIFNPCVGDALQATKALISGAPDEEVDKLVAKVGIGVAAVALAAAFPALAVPPGAQVLDFGGGIAQEVLASGITTAKEAVREKMGVKSIRKGIKEKMVNKFISQFPEKQPLALEEVAKQEISKDKPGPAPVA